MKTIQLKLYSFNELSREAKEKALITHRDLNVNFDWWNDECEDFIELCSYLSISVDKESIKFSGFYSQGDGSAFSAKVDLTKLAKAISDEAWKAYAPLQVFNFPKLEIDRRVVTLVSKGILPSEPQIIGRYRNYGVVVDLGVYVINENGKIHDLILEELDKLEMWLRSIAETLNRHLYQSLEKQFEFLTGDTAIKESMLTNDYLFTADGRSANHLVKHSTYNSKS